MLLNTMPIKELIGRGALSEQAQALLLGLELHPRRISAGEVLWQERSDVDMFGVLKEGWAYSFRHLGNGSMQILKLYLPGDLLGMRDFGFSKRLAGVAMINDGIVCPFSHHQLFELFGHSAALSASFVTIAVRQQAMLTERLVYLGRHTAQQRLAHFLYELYLRLERIGCVQEDSFIMPLSQEQLGDALGLSAVHVSRTFAMLREEGLVLRDRHQVWLPDRQALADLAEFNHTYLDEDTPSGFLEL